jgi:hypothetical protein
MVSTAAKSPRMKLFFRLRFLFANSENKSLVLRKPSLSIASCFISASMPRQMSYDFERSNRLVLVLAYNPF